MQLIFRALVVVALLAATPAISLIAQEATMTDALDKSMAIKRMTPNLYTDDVESCVKFWVDRMHFRLTMEVPDGGRLAFAALQKGPVEVMYGTYASLQSDTAVAKSFQRGTSFLFLEVSDLAAVRKAMEGAPLVAPVHTTFYGSTEFTVKDPAGHLITFAEFGKR
jgi:uncharacterized glyoxalase superfamily protein PhnB